MEMNYDAEVPGNRPWRDPMIVLDDVRTRRTPSSTKQGVFDLPKFK
jgi:hypothetical protein